MAKFEKGQSGNPSGAPRKQTGKIVDVHFVATGQNMPPNPAPTDPNRVNSKTHIDWGNDNLFPNAIAQLNRKSPVHRGILNRKTLFITGKGFNVGDKNKNSKFEEWLKNCNTNRESLKAVIKKVIFDKLSCGNAFLEISIANNMVSFFHRDFTTCRVTKDKKGVEIYKNWKNIKKDEVITIPLYPEFSKNEKGVKRSIVHLKDYEPEFFDYGVASWISGMDSAGIAYKTNKWNISRLDNSFSSSGVLVVEGNISPAESKKMKEDFKKEFTGEGKQGKVMMVVKQVGGGETKFQPFTSNNEGEWLQLQNQSKQDLLDVHGWFVTLSASQYTSGITNDRARVEYNMAMSTVISEEQEVILDVIKPLISDLLKFDTTELNFIQVPLSLQDLLDPKIALTINEQRKVFGYDPLNESEMNAFLLERQSNKSPNSSAQ